MSNSISNTQDVIDSRDVIERIEELETERDDEDRGFTWDNSVEELELKSLQALASEAEGYAADWHHGEQLIRESYFTDYIEELIKDCYELPKEMNSGEWPYRHMTIDFEAAAEEAKQDYTAIDFDGTTYYIR